MSDVKSIPEENDDFEGVFEKSYATYKERFKFAFRLHESSGPKPDSESDSESESGGTPADPNVAGPSSVVLPSEKKKRGRPRKIVSASGEPLAKKRGRGRPRKETKDAD